MPPIVRPWTSTSRPWCGWTPILSGRWLPASGRLTSRPWPSSLRDGLTLAKGVTFLVGENGSGKSTLVEGVAMAYGLGSEGGSTGSQHATRGSESPLSHAACG